MTKDNDGKISLRYNDLSPLLTKTIQEQQVIIEGQSKKNEDISSIILNKRNAELATLSLRVNQIEAQLNTNKL